MTELSSDATKTTGLGASVSGFRTVLPVLPASASVAMFIAYLLPAPVGRDAASSVLIGIIAAAVVGVIGTLFGDRLTRGRDADRWANELSERRQRLETRLAIVAETGKAGDASDDAVTARLAREDVHQVLAQLQQWDGKKEPTKDYDDIARWRLLHAAEEAMLLIEPKNEVLDQALTDRRRLMGSTIPQASSLLAMQVAAVKVLDPITADKYFAPIAESASGGPAK
jgi:hypothetical protein